MNDTRVVPAQVRSEPEGIVVLFLDPIGGDLSRLRVLLSAHISNGTTLNLPRGCKFTIDEFVGGDPEAFEGHLELAPTFANLADYLDRTGEPPLPPYIERVPDKEDTKSYQTVFANTPGAIAAPTAGLHFHAGLLARLQSVGVDYVTVTLHVGYGTFRSIEAKFVENHKMDAERYHISSKSSEAIWRALKEGRRVIAVGTTSTRTLETNAAALLGPSPPGDLRGQSTLFIYPPYNFKILSGLVTNFHYPKTSVLTLTSAFCGSKELLIDLIYKEALAKDYLWYSYGDGMIVL